MASLLPLLFFLLLITPLSNTTTTNQLNSICSPTPYPSTCIASLKLSISISINPSLLTVALHSIQSALSSLTNLTPLLSIVEPRRGALLDCQQLHRLTLASLQRSESLVTVSNGRRLPAVRAHLAAALTNRATCLDGLAGARGPLLPALLSGLRAAYEPVSNSLSIVARAGGRPKGRGLGSGAQWPAWVGREGRRLLEDYDYDEQYSAGSFLTVAKDGTGNFSTVGDAVAFAANNSDERTVVFIRAGVYYENVEVGSEKSNLVFMGEGSDVTVISGSRSVGDGWTTFRSATVAISGQGFLARDIKFQNTAGPAKGQAVALRVNADLVAFYRCAIDGYQDTHYVHSFRQFYRECDISGTVDFIFGNAAVVFQGCNIIAKKPLPGQSNMITAQSKDDPNEDTGISIQNCTILASNELASNNGPVVRSYLGRPWRNYSTTVVMESYIDGLIDAAGWSPWSGNQGLDTLYYGEYMNYGPGAGTEGRVNWPGFHVMGYNEAYSFTVEEFIYGDEWLDSTSFPYDDGI